MIEANDQIIDLLTRLKSMSNGFSPTHRAFRECMQTIEVLVDTNKQLNRRITQNNAAIESKIQDLESKVLARTKSSQCSFDRLSNAHNEIRLINDEIRKAIPDGCDDYGYHSVMDSRADGGPVEPGTVWANRYKSSKGGIVSRRPVDLVALVVQELLDRRVVSATLTSYKADPEGKT